MESNSRLSVSVLHFSAITIGNKIEVDLLAKAQNGQ